jgi:2'-5' RNA ligase
MTPSSPSPSNPPRGTERGLKLVSLKKHAREKRLSLAGRYTSPSYQRKTAQDLSALGAQRDQRLRVEEKHRQAFHSKLARVGLEFKLAAPAIRSNKVASYGNSIRCVVPSSHEGPGRQEIRKHGSTSVPQQTSDRGVPPLDVPLQLRKGASGDHVQSPSGHDKVLRLLQQKEASGSGDEARQVRDPDILNMESHAGSVPSANSIEVPDLRRSGDQHLQKVGLVREFLQGHGGPSSEAHPGQEEQRRGLLPEQLPVGLQQDAGSQQAIQSPPYTSGPNNVPESLGGEGGRVEQDPGVSAQPGMVGGEGPDNPFWKAAAGKGTPPPRVGDVVKVRLEDRTKMDSQSIIPMGEIPGTLSPADGDPYDVAPIDVPLSKTKGEVKAEIVGKVRVPDGNHKWIAKTKPGKLTPREGQNIQSFVAARQVWQKGLKIQVPGVNNITVQGASGKPTKTAASAVLIMGNPKFIAGNRKANVFYDKVQEHLEGKGYDVTRDVGKPHTSPAKADLWIGHSRGADRLRFAPEGTKTVAIGSASPGAINHPRDDTTSTSGPRDENPNRFHYSLTAAMKKELDKHAGTLPGEEQMLRQMLHRFRDEMKGSDLDFFLVAGKPGSNVGGSVYQATSPDSAARNARKAHMGWERAQGIDPYHDASKSETNKHAGTLSSIVRLDHESDFLQATADRLRKIVPELHRETKPENFHVTLSYANGIKPQDMEPTAQAMQRVIDKKIPMSLGPIQTFENPRGDTVVAFGIKAPGLAALHRKVKGISQDAGGRFTFPRFKPHATIGYIPGSITPQQKQEIGQAFTEPRKTEGTQVDITKRDKGVWKPLAIAKMGEGKVTLLDLMLRKNAAAPAPEVIPDPVPDLEDSCPTVVRQEVPIKYASDTPLTEGQKRGLRTIMPSARKGRYA